MKIELLAPAGNPEMLKVAVQNGADAVYLGLKGFNARMSADNFNEENLRENVKFAHSHGTRVFVTLNTLANNNEMADVLKTAKCAVESKVDAFIVQDFGIVKALKSCFKDIEIHASTQMGIHNLEGAIIAEKMGIKRVVLSRETKLEDIKLIKQNTNLELEFFVQGALCVAFSGNCYFSSMMQDESGNRGRCKQYCRMNYTSSFDENEKYLLSARDLCLIENLKTLINAGITSFKIEGRLRRPAYVAQTVQSYRFALDNLNKNVNLEDEIFKLKKVFSRGEFSNDAYLNFGVPDNIINEKTQNHLGIRIGVVTDVKPFKDLFKVTINSTHPLAFSDGLKFLDGEKQVFSLGVGNVEKIGKDLFNIYTKHKIKKGFNVNLILDSVYENNILQKTLKIPFTTEIKAFSGKNLFCKLKSGKVEMSHISDFVLEQAKNSPTTKEDIKNQFSKLGNTDFCLTKIDVLSDDVFIAKSVLNNFRREALEKLFEKIIEENEKQILAKIDEKNITNFEKLKNSSNKLPAKNLIIINENNLDFFEKQDKKLFKDSIIFFSPQKFNLESFENFSDKLNGLKIGLNLPIIANQNDMKIIKQILEKNKDVYVLANNIFGLYFCKSHKVIAGTNLNIFSDYSKSMLEDFGVTGCVMSIEQELKNIESQMFVFSLGYSSLMTFAHCPFKTINKNNCNNCSYSNELNFFDIQKNKFKIVRQQISQCYFSLLNSTLTNNVGYSNFPLIDLQNLTQEIQEKVLKNLEKNEKIKFNLKTNLGKILKQVN